MFRRCMCLWNLWRKRVLWLFQFTMRVRTSHLGTSFAICNGYLAQCKLVIRHICHYEFSITWDTPRASSSLTHSSRNLSTRLITRVKSSGLYSHALGLVS